MRKVAVGLVGLSLAATSVALAGSAYAQPLAKAPSSAPSASEPSLLSDELPNPLESKRRELRDVALQDVISGKAKPEVRNGSTVLKVGKTALSAEASKRAGGKTEKDQYVELQRERTDRIFVILAEFGNERHPDYPDKDTAPNTPGPARFDGPLHNEIPAPDRTVDNSTVWQPDYNADHFRQLYFGTGQGDESLKQYYEQQSSGRYTVDGVVTDWVKVPFNEARYGRSNGFPCGSNVCSNTWDLIRDAANQWYADQIAKGRSEAEVNADLAEFDKWDRYDYNGNGNFNEPDGYIDHFQIVHSGGDQADGDPWQGEDAIWSHRWAAFQGTGQGPANFPIGGSKIGNSNVWIYDYTIQPENGGRSVFFHEYAHDLGLPDDYDTSGAGDNPNEHWTLMAQSRLGAKGEAFVGDRAGDLGAWNKLQLGWLDYEVVQPGADRTLTLGPEEYNSAKPQGLVVPLGLKDVPHDVGAAAEGTHQYWSGDADRLTNAAAHTMSRQVTLPADPATLTFQARWDIEDCGPDPCDYAYVEVDAGSGWTPIKGSITKATEAAGGAGIDGVQATWTTATFDLSAYAGQTVGLRFRYETDPAQRGNPRNPLPNGLFVDDVKITAGGATVFADGGEAGANGWMFNGFQNIESFFITQHPHYYIAGWRTYVAYDQYLKSGPYYFGYQDTKPDWVDHYSYQRGLLISYWDTSQADNNVNAHPGEGRNLYIDARPDTLYRQDGQPWRTRVQLYDAPFSKWKADSFTLHHNSQPTYIRGADANPVFDDTDDYFDEALPNHGVKLPAVGVKIRVAGQDDTSVTLDIS